DGQLLPESKAGLPVNAAFEGSALLWQDREKPWKIWVTSPEDFVEILNSPLRILRIGSIIIEIRLPASTSTSSFSSP
ncbi:hypothetical protein NW820_01285, partial [Synechococcus sp. R55.7]|uniref:hypothetical protein n=1 Tax=Synechococcus sp. R55.7 TaxID=2964500 RepID=UPI0039C48934